MTDIKKPNLIVDQTLAQIVELVNKDHLVTVAIEQNAQDKAFILAQQQIDKVYDSVGKPEHILGNSSTKHGEIAEQVEVGVHNAKQALQQQPMTADIESISRISSIDYTIDGIPVQAKFINGENNTLQHVLNHQHKYPDFSQDGYYHIAKDYHDTISKVINNEHVEGLSSSTEQAIRDKVATIEAETGFSFAEIVQPSVSTYADVQLGNINDTLDRHEADLTASNQQIKDNIHANSSASFTEGVFASATAAAVVAVISILSIIYKKHKAGKSIGSFTVADWKEMGVSVGKDTITAGISGAAIYTITNCAELSAPFAAAIVSASKAIAPLLQQYKQGKITGKAFTKLAMISCSESAIVGLFTVAGQTLIPIPVIGALVGAISGQILLNFVKGNSAVYKHVQEDIASFIANLDDQQQQIFAQIEAKFQALGDLTTAAFDISNNQRLVEASIALARYYSVPEQKIIKTKKELDDYYLN